MIIYLVSAPGHEITGYGDGLIDGDHEHLLVSYLEYMGSKLKPLRGFNRSQTITHPCFNRCQYAEDVGMPEHRCDKGQCQYEINFPELKAREAAIIERLGEPEAVNADLLGGP